MFSNKIIIVFFVAVLMTLVFLYITLKKSNISNRKSSIIMLGLMAWLVLQGVLTSKNVYNTNLNSLPPKLFIFGILPTVIFMILLFLTKQGRKFIDGLNLKYLTLVSCVRILVELVLYWLFLEKYVPKIMTFEGSNFDILAGISAPIIAWCCFKKEIILKRVILFWNLLCLALLANIVFTAILAAPSPIQKLAFNQPNIAILNFPISWLPTFIVPVILFSHLVSIRQLMYILLVQISSK